MTKYNFNNRNKELGRILADLNESLAREKQRHRQSVYDLLARKKRHYLMKADTYIEQLEKNIIYSAEGTLDVLRAAETYLAGGFTRLRNLEPGAMVRFIQSIPFIEAKERARHHFQYLSGTCPGCLYHAQHEEYAGLKECKAKGPAKQYTEELEFNYIYHQLQNKLAKHYLLVFVQHDEKMAKVLKTKDDIVQVRMNLHFITNYILDNITYEE